MVMEDVVVDLNDELRYLAIEEAYGRASTDQRELLVADPLTWHAVLVEAVDLANERLANLNARWAEYEVTNNNANDPEYRAASAEYLASRARTIHFKRKIEARIRYVKALGNIRSGDGVSPWRSLAEWLYEQFAEDERPGLEQDCPPRLRPKLDVLVETKNA